MSIKIYLIFINYFLIKNKYFEFVGLLIEVY